MARFPTYQAALLEVCQSLGLPALAQSGRKAQSSTKQKFVDLAYSIEKQKALEADLLQQIGEALEVGKDAWADFLHAIDDMADMCKQVELRTRTFAASERQVLWQVLAILVIPGLAKRLAFWALAGRFDRGMPGGRFCFLPQVRDGVDGPTLAMAVSNVVDWLFDLLGAQAHELAANALPDVEASDAIQRNLHNWTHGQLPEVQSIRKYFADSQPFTFRGRLRLPAEASVCARFEAAREFVQRRGLSIERLSEEIPIPAVALTAILCGEAAADVREIFVDELAERYAEPSLRTVRQRLLVARMVQDGYERLLAFLCPGVPKDCPDPAKNKVLQLLILFTRVYNLTIAAARYESEWALQDAWMYRQLAEWEREEDLFALCGPDQAPIVEKLGGILSARFRRAAGEYTLEDTGYGSVAACESRIRRFEKDKAAWVRQRDDYARLAGACRPDQWIDAIARSTSFDALCAIALHRTLQDSQRELAFHRLGQLDLGTDDRMLALLAELDYCLDDPGKRTVPSVRERVEGLLAQATACTGRAWWQAELMHYEGKHQLSLGRFEQALEKLKEALDASESWSCANERGLIARDVLAVGAAKGLLRSSQHERYFRIMRAYRLPEAMGALQDTIESVLRHFDTLYQPYVQMRP